MGLSSDSAVAVRYLARHRALVGANFAVLILMGASEGIGLGMVIPMLESMQGTNEPNFFSAAMRDAFAWAGLPYTVPALMGVFAAVMVVRFALQAVQMYIGRLLSSAVVRDLRDRAFESLMTAPLAWFHARRSGDVTSTVFTSTQNAGGTVEAMLNVLVSLVFCVVYLALNVLISWQLTIAALVLVAVSAVLLVPRVRIGFGHGQTQKTVTDRLTSFLVDHLGGIKTVKAYHGEARHEAEFKGLTRWFQRTALDIQVNRIIADLLTEPMITLLAIALTTYALMALDISVVMLITFFVVLLRMVPRMKQASASWLDAVNLLPHFSKVYEIIGLDGSAPRPDGTRGLDSIETGIRFESAGFTHAGARAAALKGVDLDIPRNATVALVGESGSGKTTCVDLLLRHYEPTAGRIAVDGIDLSDIRRADWHRLVAVVDQDAHLFHDTVAGNIRYGAPEADDERVRDAARLAHALDFIEAMPEGFDTIVGDRGTRLSGGQRQRIALARALAKDPQVLILDEATSALDSESERLIQQAIEGLRHSKTIIMIAHRLSTVLKADSIVVLADGRVVGAGPHRWLVDNNPTYRNFVELQFAHDA